MNRDNRELFAHLALAIGRYLPEAQREAGQMGHRVPTELLSLGEFFADCARMRQDATKDAASLTAVEPRLMTDAPMLTKREAAALLRVSVRQLERLLSDDSVSLGSVRVGGAVRVRRTDLDAYVAGLGLGGASFRDDVDHKAAQGPA